MKSYFLTGLALLLPLTIALLLTTWLFYLLSIPFYSIYHHFFANIFLSRLFSFLSVLASVTFVGFFAKYYIVQKIIAAFEGLMKKVPFVRSIYHAAQEVVRVISREEGRGFSEAVLLSHPSPCCRIVGFIPRRDIILHSSLSSSPFIPVFVPGTVNPLMGFLVFTTEEYINPLNISTKDAFIWTVSLGGKDPF
jgi:uncharacterized membrane protein